MPTATGMVHRLHSLQIVRPTNKGRYLVPNYGKLMAYFSEIKILCMYIFWKGLYIWNWL